MGDMQFDALVRSQPQWVWLLGIVALLFMAYRFDWLSKLQGVAKKTAVKPKSKSSALIADDLLPPGVVEMRKSIDVMKKQLDDLVVAETTKIVNEYTKYMSLTASQAVTQPKT